MRVLIIEDSSRLRTYIGKGLRAAGFAVDTASDGEEGLFLAVNTSYDAVILDLTLPKLDGMIVLREMRAKGIGTHVLILTARDAIEDKVHGLQDGADDYLVKPFAFEELLARVQTLVRRGYGIKTSIVRIGPIVIDITRRMVFRNNEPLPLKHREYALIEYLALQKGRLVTRTEIEQHIYDEQVEPMSNVVDSAICVLRKNIDLPDAPSLIQTRRGLGYIFGEEE